MIVRVLAQRVMKLLEIGFDQEAAVQERGTAAEGEGGAGDFVLGDPDGEVLAQLRLGDACILQRRNNAVQVANLVVIAAGDDKGVVEVAQVVKDRAAAGDAPQDGDLVALAPA